MFKLLKTLFSSFCIATVLSQLLGIGMLWYRGQLTMQFVRDVRLILEGTNQAEDREEADRGAPHASIDDELRKRIKLSADFNNKERELVIVEGLLNDRAERLQAQQTLFESRRSSFQKELENLRNIESSESTQQARGVLLKLPSRDAADRLMQLSLDQSVMLLKGMSEKDIARILKEFKSEEPRVKRGNEIFEKLSNGGRIRELIDKVQEPPTTQATPEKPPAAATGK